MEKKSEGEEEKLGTKLMGAPASPDAHPENQRAAAFWTPRSSDDHHYVLEHKPVPRPAGSPMESILDVFNAWTKKTDELATNIWHNCNLSLSFSDYLILLTLFCLIWCRI